MLSNIRRRVFVPAIAVGIFGLLVSSAVAANQLNGGMYTTNFSGTTVNQNHFAFKEAVFFNGDTVLRGSNAVAEAWSRYYEGKDAPFSWTPEAVAVLESGTLGLSYGPVLDPEGNRIGTFNSVWRRNADGEWKIVFDRGCPACD